MAQMYPDLFIFFVPLPTQRLFIYLGSAITQKWNKQKRESGEYNGGMSVLVHIGLYKCDFCHFASPISYRSTYHMMRCYVENHINYMNS